MLPIPDNSRRAKLVIWSFWVLLAVKLVYIGLNRFYSSIFATIIQGIEQLLSISIPVYMTSTVLNIPFFCIQILILVVFLLWFRQAYQNLSSTGYPNNYKSVWAVVAWFIPVVNFILPYKIAKEIWCKTQHTYTAKVQGIGWLVVWWVFFVGSNPFLRGVVFIVFYRMGYGADTWRNLSVFREILATLLVSFSLILVYKISSFERRMRQHLMVDAIGQTPASDEDSFYAYS